MGDARFNPRGEESSGYLRAGLLLASALGVGLLLQALLGSNGIDAADFAAAAPLLLRGIGLTAFITVVSVLLGSALGAGLLAGLLAPLPPLKAAIRAFCIAFRGTPAIAQLYLIYYGAGEIHGLLSDAHLWWFFRDPLNCVIFTFTLNSAAYQTRILHGALVNLPREQTDAVLSLGLPRRVALLRVLLPQALLTALRPLGNELTKMTKASSVASLVTVLDLLGTAKYLVGQSLDFGFYILAAVLYVLLIGAIRLVVDLIERRLTRHLSPVA
jgi:polar amino acid transport system permease protein